MKLYQKFLALTRAKQIAAVVFAFHFLVIFALLIHHWANQRWKPIRPMIVRTIPFSPPIAIVPTAPSAITTTTPLKPTSTAPKPAKKPAPPKLSSTKPNPASPTKKVVAPAQQITQSPNAPAKPSFRSRPSLPIPQKISAKSPSPPALPLDRKEDPTYGEYLIAYLQNALDLPEYGEVKIKMEIDRFGRLIDCEILEAKSRKNADFLKNQLPDLTFPCLNDFGIIDATHTFTVTFRNVEIHP